MSLLPCREQFYHLYSANWRSLIVNHQWHTEYACAWCFMSTYVRSTVQSACLCWYANGVMCVGVCVWFLSIAAGVCVYIFALSCKPSLTLTPVWNPQWSDMSALRGREIVSLCFVFADETPVDCAFRHREQIGQVKVSVLVLQLIQHTRSVPTIHLQGFSFTIHIHYMQAHLYSWNEKCFIL